MDIRNKLGKELLFFDGAMGSMLQKSGLKTGELPESLNITNKDLIIDIHKKYLEAGSDIISANTFGAYSTKYNNLDEIIENAVKNAKSAISTYSDKHRYIALDMGSVGKLIKPLGELEFDECYEIFKESALLGEKHGADLIILETLSDTYEAKAALLAIKENTNLPVIATMTFDEKGLTLTGADIITVCTLLEGLGADAIGINCGLGPIQIKEIFDTLMKYASVPVLIQPNAGLPHIENGKTVYDITADEFALNMSYFAKNGAWILGGCCGTTPEHIKKTIELCSKIKPLKIEKKNYTIITSYSKHVLIDKKPIIVGERINPTGKKKFKQALKDRNLDYILNEALTQVENGADVLDVNVGLPEINEMEIMNETVKKVQACVDLPLQIDSSTKEVIESALRIYNGIPLINSVNGKEEIMKSIFPLVKKYGGVVVGLTLDENGIPPLAEERLEIARKIVQTAEKYGIDKKNIIIDTLTLTISAQQKEAIETIKALTLVRNQLNVKTILGVSNISFGLPNRNLINTTFLTMALYAGLNACIINPLSSEMIDVINAYNALNSIDDGCINYINFYGSKKDNNESISLNSPTDNSIDAELKHTIIKGIKDSSYNQTKQLLQNTQPIKIINNIIVPALDEVGVGYEKGIYFLPQLIMSAETAKNSFKAIQEYLNESGEKQEKKGKIVIATVEGDIHDIGKNIVKALLENYGFEVIDLGKDVSSETIVKTIVENDIKLVGLSALMTTTVTNMEKTIKQIRQSKKDCKILVGGAVLNEDYSKMIGADFYGKDALASVAYALKIFDKGDNL